MARGKTGAVRRETLKTAGLGAAERHGKREDEMGKQRRVRDREPLVYGSLDLRDARDAHAAGAQQQGQTAALHMLIQYPTAVPVNAASERNMLDHAVRFVDQYYGGDAVFAARLDRDEKGVHTVDVFALPMTTFTYKDGRTQRRVAISKASKARARAYFETLPPEERVTKKGKPIDPEGPFMQGRALQQAWEDYQRDVLGFKSLEPRKRKKSRTKDRLEPEELGLRRDQAKVAKRRAELVDKDLSLSKKRREQEATALEQEERAQALKAGEEALERQEAELAAQRARLAEMQEATLADAAAASALKNDAQKREAARIAFRARTRKQQLAR